MGGSKAAIFAGIGLAVLGLAGCGTTDAGDSTDSMNFEQMDSGSVSKDPADSTKRVPNSTSPKTPAFPFKDQMSQS